MKKLVRVFNIFLLNLSKSVIIKVFERRLQPFYIVLVIALSVIGLLGQFVLVGLVHLCLIAILISSLRYKKRFDEWVGILLFLVIAHTAFVFLQIDIPLALLYGPVIYCLQKSMKKIKKKSYFLLHFFPFLLFMLFYKMLDLSIQVGSFWTSSLSAYYYPAYFFFASLSLAGYSLVMLLDKHQVLYSRLKQQLVLQLSLLTFANAFL